MVRTKDDRIDYQINKILYHFERLRYLGGISKALQILQKEGYLDNPLITRKNNGGKNE